VFVIHSDVEGAVGYVMVSGDGLERPCNALLFSNTCVAVLPSAPGCGTTLRAVDIHGTNGLPSESFCVPRSD